MKTGMALGRWLSITAAVAAAAALMTLAHPTIAAVALGAVAVTVLVRLVSARSRKTTSSAPVGLLAAIALCGGVPVAFIWATPISGASSWSGPATILIGVGARLAWMIGRGDQRLGEAMVWIFAYMFLGLAPMVQARLQHDPETTPSINHELDWPTFWVVAVGLTAFAVGLGFARRHAASGSLVVEQPYLPKATRLTILALTALVAGWYFITSVGLSTLFSSRSDLGVVAAALWPDPTVNAMVRALSAMPLLVAFI